MSVVTRVSDSRVGPWFGTLVRLVVAGTWGWAAVSKLGNPRQFVQAVRVYDATPEWLSKAIGYGLPVLEMCLAVLLLIGLITRLAAAVSAVLFLVFLVGLVQASARGIRLDCGCFGGGGITDRATGHTLDILRDVGLLILAVLLVVWPLTRLSVDSRLARRDVVLVPSAKRMRTEQGRRKYEAEVARRTAEARVRTRYLTAALAVVVVLVSVIGIGVQADRATISGTLTATNANVVTGVTVGKAAPVTVDLFEDFQCPVCKQFETETTADVSARITAGTIQVRYHMISILDSDSNGNDYSTRAANAGICMSDISAPQFKTFHDYLYAGSVQPAEGGDGRTDADFATYAKAVGVTGTNLTTFQGCVSAQTHKAFVEATTDNASKRGIHATPTVLVNGKQMSTLTKAGLDAALSAAAAK